MNIHLYLYDCARSTNLDQEWCLIERTQIGYAQSIFISCHFRETEREFNDRLDRCSCDIYVQSLNSRCYFFFIY